MQAPAMFIMEKRELNRLIQLLREEDYRVIGPVVRDGAIIYDDVESTEQLPRGWTQHVGAAACRLERRDDDALFGYAVGPQSWKKYLFPPRLRLFSITRDGRDVGGYRLTNVQPAPRLALIGVRACELAALDLQDRVFAAEMADPYYTAVRREAIIIAVNCTEPGGTCFCDSMNTGPSCRAGYDLALTELDASFAVQAGSARGEELLRQLSHQPADGNARQLVNLMLRSAAARMGRRLDTEGLPEILLGNPDHPHWQNIAERCLACANCTLVCPTCFCSSIEDKTDLTGNEAERWRSWGSCFTLEFSYHTGGFGRSSIRARYRQWLTHKLAGWHEQFGASGCVGCGRCITWCPVGIDLTAEARAIAESVRRSEKEEAVNMEAL